MHPDNRWNPFGVRMINAVFDVFFFFDLIVVFRTGIVERRKDNDERYVNFVTSNVMKRYLCGWFFVDLVATIPWIQSQGELRHQDQGPRDRTMTRPTTEAEEMTWTLYFHSSAIIAAEDAAAEM